jgi:hypothetical protein
LGGCSGASFPNVKKVVEAAVNPRASNDYAFFFREIVKVGSPTILAHFLYRCEKSRGAGRDPQR